MAEILSVDLDPFRHRLVIDKGIGAGLFVGQAMLDADGVVGQVTRVDPLSAEAITIALGTGDSSRLLLPFLPNNADVQAGDLLVTSGLGDAFPYGYPVARVVAVDRRPGEPFAEIVAEPTAALNREREILLVWQRERVPDSEPQSPDDSPGESPDGSPDPSPDESVAETPAALTEAEP